MMARHQKQMLHQLLQEDQQPFRLKSYIADRRSQLKKSTTNLQLRKRDRITLDTSTKRVNLCKHACFLSFHNSPDVLKSPFRDFQLSPARSDCKSPNAAVFLHVPSRTSALLMEAAMRIQNQQKSKSKDGKIIGSGLFGSFLRRLKDRSKKKTRAVGNNDFQVTSAKNWKKLEDTIRISQFNRRISIDDWAEVNNADKSLDFEASTSSCGSENNFEILEPRFSFHKTAPSNGSRTPEFNSPATSPCRHVEKVNEIRGEEKDKEQSSPVSILDSPFHEDDGRESGGAEGDDYDLHCSYSNVQRAKEQLLHRLRRFEKLAELDPMELEGSEDDELVERNGPVSCQYRMDTFVSEVLSKSRMQYPWMSMSTDMKKLVCDLIIEENKGAVCSGSEEVMVGKICNRLDSWKDVEMNTIDMMIGLDLEKECDGGWRKFNEQVEETAWEIEVSVFELVVDELSEELMFLSG